MKLAFLCHPVKYLKGSSRYYREVLGFEEAWQEGDHTVALKLPGSDVQLMLEDDEEGYSAGGVFIVDSVDRFYHENSTLDFVKEPCDIPPGRYAIFQDRSGNPIRIIDKTKC
ncbi:VOC family protein [Peribacillus sp. NPDC097225]|uniref:VOC family protein n=1 Tax=Peribacillus sp. NPDC097225 TaxID=3364400 RepID=UPI00381AC9DB